jgi:hypothetical protein
MINMYENHVVFRSHTNGRYVCAEDGGKRPLIANRMKADKWEIFEISPN